MNLQNLSQSDDDNEIIPEETYIHKFQDGSVLTLDSDFPVVEGSFGSSADLVAKMKRDQHWSDARTIEFIKQVESCTRKQNPRH